jgi:two-component system phosphate regulon sensor histidine kinase PhoR
MRRTIQKLKLRDFSISKRTLLEHSNPIKAMNDEIFVYVANKQKEIEELRKMEQFRREFLADVSHELKTPVFSAQGFIHTLMEGAMDDAKVRDKFLLKAAKSLDRLDILVKDLVSLSQLESGETTMALEKVNMVELTNEIFERLEKITKDRDVNLKIKPDKIQSAWVLADRQRIDQVMVNLISNAIKYNNERGKVVVLLEEDRKHFTISIRDSGPGISQEHIARIFERFYRVDKSRSRDLGGTGLGLAIVKHILNAHGSTITVMSQAVARANLSFAWSRSNGSSCRLSGVLLLAPDALRQ